MENVIDYGLIARRMTTLSAGYDIPCPIDIVCKAGEEYIIDTGLKFTGEDYANDVSFSEDGCYISKTKAFVGLLVPRSSLGVNYGFTMLNTIGIIDSDYRDTIKVPFTVKKDLELKKGDRIAQLIIVPFVKLSNEPTPTKSRYGGFGSTGISQHNLDLYNKKLEEDR